jgi:uncharacterized protein (DUF302 family)
MLPYSRSPSIRSDLYFWVRARASLAAPADIRHPEEEIVMTEIRKAVAALAVLLACLAAPLSPVSAAEVQKEGAAYVLYLPGSLDFNSVLERVKTEILAENWAITNTQNIGEGLEQYGINTQNQIVSACKAQYLAEAIKEDPRVTLIIPCRFSVFREQLPAEGKTEQTSRIVVALTDPLAEAQAINLEHYEAAKQATEELKAVLQRLAEFYQAE